jgi:BASS family bile acid:Na+ symporter
MPLSGPVEQLLTLAAGATVFTVMYSLGLGIVPRDFRWIAAHPALIGRALFCVLVAVPAIAVFVARAFALPPHAEIGIVLMAISPGAPVALHRALDAGGHRAFAPALQLLVALLAAVSMPMSIALLDEVYAGSASISIDKVARQVLVAQLVPLALGMLTRRLVPRVAKRVERSIARAARWTLVALTFVVVAAVWDAMIGAGARVAAAVVVVTVLALGVGHRLGGRDVATRTAVAISSAARNAGLALLVATQNGASGATIATILAYVVVSAVPITGYVLWRRRAASRALDVAG